MEHAIISGEAARQRRCSQHRGLDIERICLILCKYAERLEAEQADAPTAATEPAVQSTVPVSDHR